MWWNKTKKCHCSLRWLRVLVTADNNQEVYVGCAAWTVLVVTSLDELHMQHCQVASRLLNSERFQSYRHKPCSSLSLEQSLLLLLLVLHVTRESTAFQSWSFSKLLLRKKRDSSHASEINCQIQTLTMEWSHMSWQHLSLRQTSVPPLLWGPPSRPYIPTDHILTLMLHATIFITIIKNVVIKIC